MSDRGTRADGLSAELSESMFPVAVSSLLFPDLFLPLLFSLKLLLPTVNSWCCFGVLLVGHVGLFL